MEDTGRGILRMAGQRICTLRAGGCWGFVLSVKGLMDGEEGWHTRSPMRMQHQQDLNMLQWGDIGRKSSSW